MKANNIYKDTQASVLSNLRERYTTLQNAREKKEKELLFKQLEKELEGEKIKKQK
jgi:hypothetical protein